MVETTDSDVSSDALEEESGALGTGGSSTSLVTTIGTPVDYVGPNIRLTSLLTAPPSRAFQGGALDVVRNENVIFGGLSSTGAALGDTWTWNGYSWTQKSPATSPSARSSAVMVWDSARNEVVLFGGRSSSGSPLADTWVWNGTTWTQKFPATSPPARQDAAATFVGGAVAAVTLFGGLGSTGALSDTWRWTGTTWQSLTTTGSPTARWQSSMAYSPVLDQTILFGGESASAGAYLDDTWILQGSTWTQATPAAHSSAMRNHVLVYNPALSIVQMFGGRDASTYSNEKWGWANGSWARIITQTGVMTGTASVVIQAPAATPSVIGTGQLLFQGGLNTSGVAHSGVYRYDWSPYGDRPEYDLTSVPLSDQTSVYVNHGTANIGIRSTDIVLSGVGAFTLERRYVRGGGFMQKDLSAAWVFNTGNDLRLGDLPDGDKILFNEQGSMLWFDKSGTNYVTPPGIDATLQTVTGAIELTYNASGRKLRFVSNKLVSDTDRDGNAVTFTYNGSGKTSVITDTKGRTLTFSYNGAGRVSMITESTGRTWTYGYDASGDLTTFTNAENETTTYTFSSFGSSRFPTKITTPEGHQTVIGYPAGNQITLTRITNVGAQTGLTTTFTSDPTYVTGATSRMTITDPLTHNTYSHVDHYSRLALHSDSNGHVRSVNWTPNSLPLTLTGQASSSIYTYAYDLNNRLTSSTPPSSTGATTPAASFGYYGNVSFPYQASSGVDPQGNCTALRYNATGNVSQINTAAPGTSTGCDLTTAGNKTLIKRQGDPISGGGTTNCGGRPGQVCATVDANNNTTSFAYDTAGNLITVTPPSPLGATTIQPDAEGRPFLVTDGAGRITRTYYDNQDRVVKILYNNTTTCTAGNVNCLQYTYDDDGRIEQRISDLGTTGFTYDTLGRLIQQDLPSAGFANVCATFTGIRFGYDNASNLTTYCDGQGTVTYGYDNANQITSIQEPGGNCALGTGACTKFRYEDYNQEFYEGKVWLITYPASTGIYTNFNYDDALNLQSIQTVDMNSGAYIQNTGYSYTTGTQDRALKQYQDSANSLELDRYFQYDASNQLCWAAISPSSAACTSPPSAAYAYTYDPNGNRTSEKDTAGLTTNYAFNAANEMCARAVSVVASCSASNFTYDATGNRLTGPTGVGPTWTYNAKNQAASYTPPSASAVNIGYHDTDSTQQATIGVTSFAHSALGLAADETTARTTAYTRTPFGEVLSQRVGANTYYYIKDDIGSVLATFDQNGDVKRTYQYDPLGRSTATAGTGDASYYRYASGYLLTDIGMYKFGTRYYDPNNSGVWTQPDPSGQDPNPYAYVGGNPANYTDPSGLYFGEGLVDGVSNFAEDIFDDLNFCEAVVYTVGFGSSLATASLSGGLAYGAAAAIAVGTIALGETICD